MRNVCVNPARRGPQLRSFRAYLQWSPASVVAVTHLETAGPLLAVADTACVSAANRVTGSFISAAATHLEGGGQELHMCQSSVCAHHVHQLLIPGSLCRQ